MLSAMTPSEQGRLFSDRSETDGGNVLVNERCLIQTRAPRLVLGLTLGERRSLAFTRSPRTLEDSL